MSTSQNTWLTRPQGDAKISIGTFGYINARIRQRAYDLVIREFKRSGLTQAELSRRWGKAPEIVSRFLARPSNWELNTLSEALFAISGAVPVFSVGYVGEDAVSASPQSIQYETTEKQLDVDTDLKSKAHGDLVFWYNETREAA